MSDSSMGALHPGVWLALAAIGVVMLGTFSTLIWHAIATRTKWNRGREQRLAQVRTLPGSLDTYSGMWGFDTIRAVKRIARLREETLPPKVSPHFVVAVSEAGLWLLHGATGHSGLTVVYPEEFRSIKTASSGPPVFTAWYVECVIHGQSLTLPIRVSDPSSDFLTADYSWAKQTAGAITARLNLERER